MPYEPPPELAAMSLAEIASLVAARKLPPVDQWNPQEVDDSHMEIAADGRWYHEGGEITRPAMVRAFASLLTRDAAGQHWLVTPLQRLCIAVADSAFIAIDVAEKEGNLTFRLNTDDLVIAGPGHPLRAAGTAENPAIYLAVRNGCEARLNRSTWLQLTDLADDSWSVASAGTRYSLVPEA